MMNPLARLCHWYREWRIERHALKARDAGEPRPSEETPLPVDPAADPRTRLIKGEPGPRII